MTCETVTYQKNKDLQHGRYLVFMIGSNNFGIELQYIREIIGIQEITKTPHISSYNKGNLNLRGKTIPVIDVRRRFLMNEIDYTDRTSIIILELLDIYIGLLVDSVGDVHMIIPEDEFPMQSSNYSKYVQSIGKMGDSFIMLLECEALVIDSVVDILNKLI